MATTSPKKVTETTPEQPSTLPIPFDDITAAAKGELGAMTIRY